MIATGDDPSAMRCGVIAIPTFRRPDGLEQTLLHVALLDTTVRLTVLVADNDAVDAGGAAVVGRLEQAGYRFPLRVISVARTGVVHVRNALITAALDVPDMAFVACIDDDEFPDPHWLAALLDMQRVTGADAVGGTVLPVFSAEPPRWVSRLDIYWQEARDGPVAMLWGTSNVLITRDMLEALGPPFFDVRFNRSGGEDTEFFHRARAAGFSFAWASRATVFETVPPHRTTLRWLLRRSFRIGGTNALIQLSWRYRRLGRVRIVLKAVGRLLAVMAQAMPALLVAARPRSGPAVVRLLSLSARSLGELAALTGFRSEVYK